ncbi:MAG: putative ribonuclease [Tardiphaga sp.]|uniref:YihY/virulence factor BrkB family protein n=1 Tax=Tardiphaga sp. TaxID=1926292 RepID=UPI002629EC33|nr:YihY/virulence factor BrkB family protein [Tardiphaga sp.]MDB5505264.1 putative ribonuclease [Tardiphaga sp.]
MLPTSDRREDSMLLPLAFLAFAAVVAFALPEGEVQAADNRRASSKPAGGGDSGHGRQADSPTEIPARGWKDVLKRTGEQIGKDRLLAVAAGVVFYGLLALFPGVTALVSSYALFADPQTINEHLSFIANVLPAGTFSIVQDQVGRVLAKGDTKLGFAFAFGLLLAVWSANGGMKAIIDALNVVYDEEEKRGFVKLNAVSLAFTLGGLFAILASIGLVIAAPIALSTIGLGPVADAALQYGRWPALAIMVMLGLAVLYRFAPSRKTPKWVWVSVGSALATMTWILGSVALSYYLEHYAGYDATYGSLGAAIGLMMWMWMSTIVVLFGAELNSELEHQTAADSTDGSGKPMGERGAQVADTVGGTR